MRIAIKGHPTRFKEVIDALINLGGINKYNYKGNSSNIYYYINESYRIQGQFTSVIDKNLYKCYTLEEFEKEFPFKIGDKVNFKKDYGTGTHIHTITGFEFYRDEFCYLLDYVNYFHYSATKLKLHQPMKKERNIALTLDKAKEWYNKGGELKEIALQAYTKEELNPLPKSWEEYCKTHYVAINIFGPCAPLKYITLWKLEQLRDCYRQGWKPDWTDTRTNKYCIYYSNNKLDIIALIHTCGFLSFQSQEVAEEFLKNFKSLIKEADDLIS